MQDEGTSTPSTPPALPPGFMWPSQVPTLAETIRLSFRLLREDRRLQWVVVLLVLVQGIVNGGWEFAGQAISESLGLQVAAEWFPITVLDVAVWAVLWLLASFFFALLLLSVEGAYRSTRGTLGELAPAALSRTLAVLAVSLLTMLASMPGMLLCIIPGVIIAAFLSLAESRTVLGGEGPLVSLRWSWNRPTPVRYLLLRTMAMTMLLYAAAAISFSLTSILMSSDWTDPAVTTPLYLGIPMSIVFSAIGAYVWVVQGLIYLQLEDDSR